jgi:hypothetical protein
MNTFKKVTTIIKFCADALSAISKGVEVASASWPTGNPFKSDSNVEEVNHVDSTREIQ